MTDWSKRDKLSEEERAYIKNNLAGGVGDLEEHDRYWADKNVSDEEIREGVRRQPESVEDADDDYEEWTVAELREELGNRDLGAQGNKAELVNRLRMNDRENAAASS